MPRSISALSRLPRRCGRAEPAASVHFTRRSVPVRLHQWSAQIGLIRRSAGPAEGREMTYQSMDRSRYVFPALGSVYSALERYSWPLVRAATGFFFLPHGMQKLFGFWGGDILKTAEGFAKQGLNPSLFWAYYIGCLEFFGGICLTDATRGGALRRLHVCGRRPRPYADRLVLDEPWNGSAALSTADLPRDPDPRRRPAVARSPPRPRNLS